MSVSQQLAEWLHDYPLPGGLTYAGHPLACASGVAAIRAMQDERALENAARLGQVMRDELAVMAQNHLRSKNLAQLVDQPIVPLGISAKKPKSA